MGSPITLQNLIDAETDCATIAAVVNGPASGAGSTVVLRTGQTVPTLAKIMAALSSAQNITTIQVIDGDDGSLWQVGVTAGQIQVSR